MMQGLSQAGASIFINGFPSGPKPYEEVLTFLRKGRIRRISIAWIHRWQRGQETAIFRKLPQPSRAHLSFSVMYIDEAKKERTLDVICNSPNEFELWFWGVQIVKHYPPQAWAAHVQQLQQQQLADALRNSTKHAPWESKAKVSEPNVDTQQSSDVPSRAGTHHKGSAGAARAMVPPFHSAPTGAKVCSPPRNSREERRERLAQQRQHLIPAQTLYSNGKRELGDLYVWGSLVAGSLEEEDSAVRAGRGRWGNGSDTVGGWCCSRLCVAAAAVAASSLHGPGSSARAPAPARVQGLGVTGHRRTGGMLSGAGINPDPLHHWQQAPTPVLVQNTSSVDVVRAAIGGRHAALITRAGELYTWGCGAEGNLGLGTTVNVASPRQVTRMRGKGIKAVACSEGCTAAISSDGRMYTWGSGMAGQLGHGNMFRLPEPKLLSIFGDEVIIEQVSCGPYHTAAVSYDGTLFTWGNGLFGKLGHGDHESTFTPRPVLALADHFVLHVSCGWWHTAAVGIPCGRGTLSSPPVSPGTAAATAPSPFARPTSMDEDGQSLAPASFSAFPSLLSPDDSTFSASASQMSESAFSSTLFRQLDVRSASGPQPAAPEADCEEEDSVHSSTAAAVAAAAMQRMLPSPASPSPSLLLRGGDSVSSGTVSDVNSSSAAALQSLRLKPALPRASITASSAPVLRVSESPTGSTDVGSVGCLFTWGGEFSYSSPADPSLGGGGGGGGIGAGVKRDHHRGCLGTGDKEGRMLPTRVGGQLASKDVVQVACGWNLTVAVTRDGKAFQMGSTEGFNSDERGVAWDGCSKPTRVDGNLLGHFVEEVSCGMHHAVAVASKLAPSGKLNEETRRCRLMAWGKGAAGQLGTEVAKDFNCPQVVSVVDGRRILNIACGGQHTLAVCEHDPRDSSRRSYPPSGALTASLTSPLGNGASHMPAHLLLKATALRAAAVVPSTLIDGGRYSKQQLSAAVSAISSSGPAVLRSAGGVAANATAAYRRQVSGMNAAVAVVGRLVGMPMVPHRRISSGTMGAVQAGAEGATQRLHSSGGNAPGSRGIGVSSSAVLTGSLKDIAYSSASASDLSAASPRVTMSMSRSSEHVPQPAGRFNEPPLSTYSGGSALSRYAPQLATLSATLPAPLGRPDSVDLPASSVPCLDIRHTSPATEGGPGAAFDLSPPKADGSVGWASSRAGGSGLPPASRNPRYGRTTLESIASLDTGALDAVTDSEQLSPAVGGPSAAGSSSMRLDAHAPAAASALGSTGRLSGDRGGGLQLPTQLSAAGPRSLSALPQPSSGDSQPPAGSAAPEGLPPCTSPHASLSAPTAATLNSEERRITDPGLLQNGTGPHRGSNSSEPGGQAPTHPSSHPKPVHSTTPGPPNQPPTPSGLRTTGAAPGAADGGNDGGGGGRYTVPLAPRVSSHLVPALQVEPSSPFSEDTSATPSPTPRPLSSHSVSHNPGSPPPWGQARGSRPAAATAAGLGADGAGGGGCAQPSGAAEAESLNRIQTSRYSHARTVSGHSNGSLEGSPQRQRQARTVSLQHHSRTHSHDSVASLFEAFAPLLGAAASAELPAGTSSTQDTSRTSHTTHSTAAAAATARPPLHAHNSGRSTTEESPDDLGALAWQKDTSSLTFAGQLHQLGRVVSHPLDSPRAPVSSAATDGNQDVGLAKENEELRRQVEALQRQLTTLLLVSNSSSGASALKPHPSMLRRAEQPSSDGGANGAVGDTPPEVPTAPPPHQERSQPPTGSLASFGFAAHLPASSSSRELRHPPGMSSLARGHEPLPSPSSSMPETTSPALPHSLDTVSELGDSTFRPLQVMNKPGSLQLHYAPAGSAGNGGGNADRALAPPRGNGYSPTRSPPGATPGPIAPRSHPPAPHHRRAMSVDVSNFAANSSRPPIAAFSAILGASMASDRISLLLSPGDMQPNLYPQGAPPRSPAWEAGVWSSPNSEPWVFEPEPGVFLYLQNATATAATVDSKPARPMLMKVRYSRRSYSNMAAKAWWTRNKDTVTSYCDTSQVVSGPSAAVVPGPPAAATSFSPGARSTSPAASSPVRQLVRNGSQHAHGVQSAAASAAAAAAAAASSPLAPPPGGPHAPVASVPSAALPVLPFMSSMDMPFSVSVGAVGPMSGHKPMALPLSTTAEGGHDTASSQASGSTSPLPTPPAPQPSSKPQSAAGTSRYSPLRWKGGSVSATQSGPEGGGVAAAAAAAVSAGANWADVPYEVEPVATAPVAIPPPGGSLGQLAQLAAAARALMRPGHARSASGGSSHGPGHVRNRSGGQE
ncbi:MAG: hypothetical protein WDW38_011193 [Sanguina aurantia]